MLLLQWCGVWLWSLFVYVNGYGNLSDIEINALHELYAATNGDDWFCKFINDPVSWNFSSPVVNPCEDQWQGIFCNENCINGTLCTVVELDLENCKLQGSLPTSVGVFSSLSLLDMQSNSLSQSIPSEFGYLTTLSTLVLSSNFLTGTFPTSLSQLGLLAHINCDHNHFTGIFPEFLLLGSFSQLARIYFSKNSLTGHFPDFSTVSWANSVEYVTLNNNEFSGEIPSSIGALSLSGLDVTHNLLSGSLPSEIWLLTDAYYFYLSHNMFTGSFPNPPSDVVFPHMATLSIIENHFTGPFLELVLNSRFFFMVKVEITGNSISGSIPSTICECSKLAQLFASNNMLTGSLPSSMTEMTKLRQILVENNLLTGTIPALQSPLAELFNIKNNLLTGTIPSDLYSSKTTFAEFDVENNYLSGSIPSIFSSYISMNVLICSHNRLTGTLPSLKTLLKLVTLAVSANYFTGHLLEDINGTALTALTTLDVSDNSFSGHLSPELFLLPNIQTISASKNCFGGSLPTTMCHAKSLVSLGLDGLTSGEACISPMLFSVSTGIYTSNLIGGTLPECLFADLRDLRVLMLSGNGLTGTLPEITSDIVNISLNHNMLSGSLPLSFQEKYSFKLCDMSYNKLSGTVGGMNNYSVVSSPNNSAITLLLEVNRLSGNIPRIFHTAPYINILSGNYFECSNPVTQLPEHDPNYSTYACGSSILDYSIYLLSGFLVLTLCGVLLYVVVVHYQTVSYNNNKKFMLKDMCHIVIRPLMEYYIYVYNLQFVHLQIDDFKNTNGIFINTMEIRTMLLLWTELRHLAVRASMVGLCVLMPAYCLFASFYATHTYQYGWFLSVAFTASYVEGIVLLILWGAFLSYCYYLMHRIHERLSAFHTHCSLRLGFLREGKRLSEMLKNIEVKKERSSWFQSFFRIISNWERNSGSKSKLTQSEFLYLYCMVPLCNCSIVLVVNGMYLYAVLNYSFEIIMCSQIALVLFKTFWNAKIVSSLVRHVRYANTSGFWYFNIDKYLHRICCQTSSYRDSSNKTTTANFDDKTNDSLSSRSTVRELRSTDGDVLIENPPLYRPNDINTPERGRQTFHVGENEEIPTYRLTNVDPNATENDSDSGSEASIDAIAGADARSYSHYHIQVLLLVFNNIVAPILVTASGDPNCFLNVFVPPETISSSLSYPSCSVYGSYGCVQYDEEAIAHSYTPPYVYYYQCSTSILTAYIPVYIVMYFVLGLVLPLFYHFVALASNSKSDQTSRSTCEEADLSNSRTRSDPNFDELQVYADLLGSKKYGLFRAPNTCCNFISHLAVLFTFGVVYPPLGLIIVMYFYNSTWTWQSLLGKLLEMPRTLCIPRSVDDTSNANDQEDVQLSTVGLVLVNLEIQCVGIWKVLNRSRYILTTSAGMFYALFLVDIVGDNARVFTSVVWVPIAMLCYSYIVGRSYFSMNAFKARLKPVKPFEEAEQTLDRFHNVSSDALELTNVVKEDIVDNPIHS